MLNKEDFKRALTIHSENENDLYAIVVSFAEVLKRIPREEINKHPISVLFSAKINDIVQGYNTTEISRAYNKISKQLRKHYMEEYKKND